MYLYFSEEYLSDLLKEEINNFEMCSVRNFSDNLNDYKNYMLNKISDLPVNDAIIAISKAYDVYTYMYNNCKEFRDNYLEPIQSSMVYSLLYYYDNFINDKLITNKNKTILKIINMTKKLEKGSINI